MSLLPTADTAIVNQSTLYIAAVPIYLDANPGNVTVTLTETTGGGTTSGTLAPGAYTKAAFTTAFQSLLNTISANGYTYTVTLLNPSTYIPVPDVSPTLYGSGFAVQKTGAGSFTFTFPDPV